MSFFTEWVKKSTGGGAIVLSRKAPTGGFGWATRPFNAAKLAHQDSSYFVRKPFPLTTSRNGNISQMSSVAPPLVKAPTSPKMQQAQFLDHLSRDHQRLEQPPDGDRPLGPGEERIGSLTMMASRVVGTEAFESQCTPDPASQRADTNGKHGKDGNNKKILGVCK